MVSECVFFFLAIIRIFNHMYGLRGLYRPTLYNRKKRTQTRWEKRKTLGRGGTGIPPFQGNGSQMGRHNVVAKI